MLVDPHKDVLDFHRKYGLGIGSTPRLPSADVYKHRRELIESEVKELYSALDERDLVKIAREAIDVIITVIGLLILFGVPFGNVWKAVHRANMLKQRATGNTKAAKPTKPPGWVGPDKAINLAIWGKSRAPAQETLEPRQEPIGSISVDKKGDVVTNPAPVSTGSIAAT